MGTSNSAPTVETPDVEEGGQGRSTIRFPYLDQDDAVKFAKAIHAVAGNSCTRDALAGYLKVSAKAGGFNLRSGTAKMFGLVETDKGIFSLTDLGKRAVDPKQEKSARAESFLTIPLYKRVFDQYRNQMLPANQALEKAMEQMGVAPKQADKARQAFQRSATQAGYFAFGNDRLIAPQGNLGDVPPPPPKFEEPKDGAPSNGGTGGGGEPPKYHPFIAGLLDTLPSTGSPKTEWTLQGRQDWLQTAAGIFNLIYKTGADDKGAVTVSVDVPKSSAN
jgi:hypothetical protein